MENTINRCMCIRDGESSDLIFNKGWIYGYSRYDVAGTLVWVYVIPNGVGLVTNTFLIQNAILFDSGVSTIYREYFSDYFMDLDEYRNNIIISLL